MRVDVMKTDDFAVLPVADEQEPPLADSPVQAAPHQTVLYWILIPMP
jgi:hypothetical protein